MVISVDAVDLIVNIIENPENGDVIGKVEGSTNQGAVTFSILNQNPEGAFAINTATGELNVADNTLYDFETNPIIIGSVRVKNDDVYKDIAIKITVLKKDVEVSVEASDLTVEMLENPEDGQVIGTIEASTNQGTLVFSIKNQIPESAFAINTTTGALNVADKNLFDFETNPTITGSVRVSNNEVFKDITVNIQLINDEGTINIDLSDLSSSIDENPPNDFSIGILHADSDEGEISFSLISQTPENALKFGEEAIENGVEIITDNETLLFFETNPVITAVIRVSNGETYQDITIEVSVNDVTTYTELVDCPSCRSFVLKDDYLYIAKSNSIVKLNVAEYTGELIEVYSGTEVYNSITFIDNYLYTVHGQRVGRIDITNPNPYEELFFQGTCFDEIGIPCGYRSLTAIGTDLYFGVTNDECDIGHISKINTIGTPTIQYVVRSGKEVASITFDESFIYTCDSGVYSLWSSYNKINRSTYETNTLFYWDNNNSYSNPLVKLAKKGDYIYTTYNYNIYKFNTIGYFNQVLYYEFPVQKGIACLAFVENDLYCLRTNKIGVFNTVGK